MAALAAIFDEEMRTEGSTTLSFTLPGVAEAMDPTDPSSYDPRLVLILPREYPAALPTTSLRGVPREIADRMSRMGLESTAREAGEACGGGAALFSIVSEVREWAEGAARRAVAAGDFATVGEPRDDDGVDEDNEDEGDGDEDDDDADDDEVEVGRWWESEDTDPALVEAATMEALGPATHGPPLAPDVAEDPSVQLLPYPLDVSRYANPRIADNPRIANLVDALPVRPSRRVDDVNQHVRVAQVVEEGVTPAPTRVRPGD